MQDFSIKVGEKKFKVKLAKTLGLITIECDGKQIRERQCESSEQAEHEYEVILDTLNDVGENFD